MKKTIGILDFQGGVQEHLQAFAKLGHKAVRVKYPEQIDLLTHLVIPGGESTVMGKYLESSGLKKAMLQKFSQGKLMLWGTCAGAILLGNSDSSYSLNLANITLRRNAYGRQINSFRKKLSSPLFQKPLEAVFIRAPIITAIGKNVQVLLQEEETPVACQEKGILISTFHPELTAETALHKHFLNISK